MNDDLPGLPGNPMADRHETRIWRGDWRAYALCTCGWETEKIIQPMMAYPNLRHSANNDQALNMATAHKKSMNRLVWRFRRWLRQ